MWEIFPACFAIIWQSADFSASSLSSKSRIYICPILNTSYWVGSILSIPLSPILGNLAFSLSKLLHWFGAWGRPESRHPFSDRHFCPQPCIPDKTEDMKSLIIHHKERAVFRLNESALERLFISPIINIASNVNLSHFIAWPFAIAQTHSGWV